MDSQRFNLTRGDIGGKLLFVSLPIIGTQLMLMGYNLVDMFLLGRVGSDAVAASGSAGMYMWLSAGLMLVGRMGAEIGVSQSKGRRSLAEAERYAHNSLFLALALGLIFAAPCLLCPDALIAFLAIREAHVAASASDYLFIVGLSIPATFLASSISGIFTGAGNSRIPFYVNGVGLVLNAILDPLFIFTLDMGVRGAAIATALSQFAACLISFHRMLAAKNRPVERLRLLARPSREHIRQILRWTVPISLESLFFTFCTMVVMRQIASYGSGAITAYRVGNQAESLCWLICLGFSSGITAFIGQNFGAGLWTRIWRGFRFALVLILGWGVFVTVLFLAAGRFLSGLFVPDPVVMAMGGDYLVILSFCQVFFCLESIAAGAFRGLGRTLPASLTSMVSNALRVPLVHILSATSLGLNGVWWGITLTAAARGAMVFIWFTHYARSRPKTDARHSDSVRESVSSDVPSVRLLP